MSDLKTWLFLLFSHWQYWVSGGGFGGVVTAIIFLVEKLRGRTMSKKWYVIVFVVLFILGASFMVWRDEHQTVEKLRKEVPKLNGRITHVYIQPSDKTGKGCILTVEAIIKNTGTPSIVSDFEMTITVGNMQVRGNPVPSPTDKLILWRGTGENRRGIIFKSEDYLPKKCLVQPIAKGGGVAGFIQGFFPDMLKEEIISKGPLSLNFKDVDGKLYTIPFDFKSYHFE